MLKKMIISFLEKVLQLKARAPKTVNLRIHTKVKHTVFGGYNVIDRGTNLQSCNIGFATAIGPNCKFAYTEIGKYCSIAPNVRVVIGTHPSHSFVSTCPVFYSTRPGRGFSYVENTSFEEFNFIDKKKKISVKIGNDVWIGSNAIILQGITIGDGAIIAAGAVVTKDVKPYSIVGGVPAKEIRKRFTDDQIAKLLDIKWWNKSSKWLKERASSFDNIEHFLNDNLEV